MEHDPIAAGAVLGEQFWRQEMRQRGWTEADIRKFESRVKFVLIVAFSAGLIGLTIWLS